MMRGALWMSIFFIVYCYFGYPLLIFGLAKLLRKSVKKHPITPSVSIVLSVWNEEGVVERKIKNLLSMDYPSEKIEILIGSDGSTDKTNLIINRFADKGVILVAHNQRQGKMATLNDLVTRAKNEIIIFNDARQEWKPNAIRELVANFADPKVGCVSGELMLSSDGGATAKGINLYWEYEKFIRRQESRLHSMLGATGAIYAIRKELYAALPVHVVLDDVYIPFKIIKQGYRAVFDPSARAYDQAADSPREEHRRKARTLYGNYQIFGLFPELFNPLVSPVAIQFFSHKFLRVAAPFLMIAVFFLNAAIVFIDARVPAESSLYITLFVFQIIFYGMAVIGGLARHQKYGILNALSKVCYIPYVFCLLNFSALIGFFRFAGANQGAVWEKARE